MVTELEALRTFYRYNSRVRRNYLKTILDLSEAERRRDRGASYPSLEAIFIHVLDAFTYWFDLVPHDRADEALSREKAGEALSPAELRSYTELAEGLADGFLSPLRPDDLDREIVCHFRGKEGVVEAKFRIGDVLWHMVEEELQHRGELNALLWQIDVEPPIAQYGDWLASKEPTG